MKSLIIVVIIYFPLFLQSQIAASNKGIKWTQELSWKEVMAKAKTENKFVFVDCYASWCGPCKKMDKEVYTNSLIGKEMNDRFVAVKIQFDTTRYDDEITKNWYADAKRIMNDYKITSFPSYLFFSPDGKIVHKEAGFKTVSEFKTLIDTAQSPTGQYYTLIKNYQDGKRDYAIMPSLAKKAKELKETEIAYQIAQDYIHNYLLRLESAAFYTKQNIKFIAAFTEATSGEAFDLFYKDKGMVDSVMDEKGYALRTADIIIYRKEIMPFMNNKTDKTEDVDWIKVEKEVAKKFPKSVAYRNVVYAKVRWYDYKYQTADKKQWAPLYVKAFVEKVDKYGLDSTGIGGIVAGNTIEYTVLRNCNDIKTINKAIGWMQVLIKEMPWPTMIDIYAGLLYKAGRVHESIMYQEKVLTLMEKDVLARKGNIIEDNDYQMEKQRLEKMKAGINSEKIWFD